MGPVRSEVMWQAVLDAVAAAGSDGTLDVLDLGGGTGGDAVRVAGLGHRVTVVDPSPDALASLHRRAVDAGVEGTVTGLQGDTGDLADHVTDGSFDLALCHGVLEHVDDPHEALAAVRRTLRPAGVVSVVVAGRLAGVLSRALAGDFEAATSLLTGEDDSLPRRFVPEEVDALLTTAGFTPIASAGLRVFADLVPSALVDGEPGTRERLWALERAASRSPGFAPLSAGLQTIARLD